jgi:predicted AAA+ superfamily ATPase
MYSRSLPLPKASFFLFGPRGTGKSTWIRDKIPAAKTLNLLKEDLYQELLVAPSLLRQELQPLKPGTWVVIDEVQRLPQLLNEVHLQIEERKLRFALTGSSARKLRARGVNLLAGRAVKRSLHILTPEELGKDFDLEKSLRHGCIPLVITSEDPQDTLRAYAETYLKEEIQAEAIVRNLPGFARFLKVAALFHGQEIDATHLARDAQVARTTVQGYLEILQDTLIAEPLSAFEAKLRTRERRHNKLYFFDPGVVRALKGYKGAVTLEEKGALLEGLVHQWLRAHQSYHELFDSIHYWASGHSDSRVEVDFVLMQGKKIHGVEVKATHRLRPEHFRGLKAFSELKSVGDTYLLYTGTRSFKTDDGIHVMPVAEFFQRRIHKL